MPSLPLIGPSYPLRNGKADPRRLINWMSVQIESGTGKGGAVGYLQQVPGLTLLGNFGGECRGLFEARGSLYGVFGNKLKAVSSAWAGSELGTLGTSTGRVGMTENVTQLAIADGTLSVYDLDALTFTTSVADFPGGTRVETLDGYGIAAPYSGSQFFLSANQDFTVWNPLDFATAESSPKDIQGFIIKHRELIILEQSTGEVWFDSGDVDFPFARNSGANMEAGCAAPDTLQKIGGVAYFLGRDDRGSGVVFSLAGYAPVRISSHALEQKLGALTDLSGAYAFTYHQEGLTFYVLQVPGLDTTWVYEVSSGIWGERAAFVDGEFTTWPATCHAFVYGRHVVGDADGNLYALDPLVNKIGNEPMVRDFISPHSALPSLQRRRYGSIQIDGQTGGGLPNGSAGRVMLRYSSDGGNTWSNWRYLNAGNVGQYTARVRATMLGADRDRVWHFRVTDDFRFEPLAIVVDEI